MTTIIQAEKRHASLIREIAERTWWPAYGKILSAGQIRYMLESMYDEWNISQQIERGDQTYLLAYEREKAVGFASFAPRKEQPEVVKLHKLYVLPDVQESGWGRKLLEEVERRAMEAGKQTLELNVNRHNKAKGFYEKMGFSVAYEEDIPIGDFWMNDYVMQKRLV